MHCWWECKLVQPLWKTIWRFLKKLKIELPFVPALPFLGIYTHTKKKKKRNQYLEEISVVPCLLQHYSKQPRHENNLIVPQQMNG